MEIENFSGKSVGSVQQDFFAKIVTLNITAIMVSQSQAIADERTVGLDLAWVTAVVSDGLDRFCQIM